LHDQHQVSHLNEHFNVFVVLLVLFELYGYRTDRRSPAGSLIRCRVQTSPLFIVEYSGANGSTNQSAHTSVLCNETPVHQSRSSAVPSLSLLGKQKADM